MSINDGTTDDHQDSADYEPMALAGRGMLWFGGGFVAYWLLFLIFNLNIEIGSFAVPEWRSNDYSEIGTLWTTIGMIGAIWLFRSFITRFPSSNRTDMKILDATTWCISGAIAGIVVEHIIL